MKIRAVHVNCGRGGASSGLAHAGFEVSGWACRAGDVCAYPYRLEGAKKLPGGRRLPRLRHALRRNTLDGEGICDLWWYTAESRVDAWLAYWTLAAYCDSKGGLFVVECDPSVETWVDDDGSLGGETHLGPYPSVASDSTPDAEVAVSRWVVSAEAWDSGRPDTHALQWPGWSPAPSHLLSRGFDGHFDVGRFLDAQAESLFGAQAGQNGLPITTYRQSPLWVSDTLPWMIGDEKRGEPHPAIARTVGLMARTTIEHERITAGIVRVAVANHAPEGAGPAAPDGSSSDGGGL